MDKCTCYRTVKKLKGWINGYTPIYGEPYGICMGTKETDQCSCNGDRLKCDFYDYIRERAEKERLEYKIKEAIELLKKNGYRVENDL